MSKQLPPALLALLLLMATAFPAYAEDSAEPASSVNKGSTITVLDGVTQNGDTADPTDSNTLAYFPVEVQTVKEDGVILIVKSFEVPSDTSTQELVEKNLRRGGNLYGVRDILKKDLAPVTESRLTSKTITLDVDTDDETEILSKLSPVIEYNESGYTGQLKLDESTVDAEATESKGYSYTIKDTQKYYGMNRNDPYYLPRTVSKNGATLKLANVNWTPMGERYDVNSIPSLYNAVATYTGIGYGSKATAFEAKATYSGEVSRIAPGNVLYTLIYEPIGLDPFSVQKPEKTINWIPFLYAAVGLLVLVVMGAGGFLLLKTGVFKKRSSKGRPAKASKPIRRFEPQGQEESNDLGYADTEMPDHHRMRVPEAMRQMERPDTGGTNA